MKIIKPSYIKNHVEGLTKPKKIDHDLLLEDLLTQIEKVDFREEAGIENGKVTIKQYTVIAIENIHRIARKNKWGVCKRHGTIFMSNGAFWGEVNKDEFQKFLGDAAMKMGVPRFTAKHYEFSDHLYKQFRAQSYLNEPKGDKTTVKINLENGTYCIGRKKELKAFDPKDFLTYQLPFAFDPNANAPIFRRYLERVLPDEDSRKVLSEYIGLVFIRHGSKQIKEEKALILYGSGANGKSVFFEVISALLGNENTSNYSLSSLTNENGYYRAKISNKLVNYASEINGKLESSIFKQLVSGEPVEARLPYGEPFTMRTYARMIFNCNELPKDVEHTNAFFRRFLIIPFGVTIPEAEQDKELHNKIIDNELSGVFNWVLEGLDRLLKQKRFTKSISVDEAIKQYRKESDSVAMFLDESIYKKSEFDHNPLKDVYRDYKTFCLEDGYRPLSKRNFTKRLEAQGVEISRRSIGYVAFLSTKKTEFPND